MKKLTAGIFTVMLGLVAVNAANAAIPSTNYVDTKITTARTAAADYADAQDVALKSTIESAYKAADTQIRTDFAAADTTTLNSAKDYTNQQVGTLTGLTTSAKDNTVAAINEVNEAYKTADTNLLNTKIGTDAMGVIKTGENASVNPTTLTQAVNALNEKIDFKTSGIATDAALGELQRTVDGHGEDISDLQAADTTMGNAIQANTQAIADHATATTNALALKANTTDLGTLAAKNSVTTSDLDSTLQGAVAQVATNKSDIESLNTTVGTMASQTDLEGVSGRVDTAESEIDALQEKTKDLGGLAYQDIIDNSDITDGTIAQAKITNLTTDLAAKVDDSQVIAEAGTVTNADAEIPTIARMNAALEEKMPLTTTADTNIGEDGTYVLTATTEGGVTTYKWELIERNMPEEN